MTWVELWSIRGPSDAMDQGRMHADQCGFRLGSKSADSMGRESCALDQHGRFRTSTDGERAERMIRESSARIAHIQLPMDF